MPEPLPPPLVKYMYVADGLLVRVAASLRYDGDGTPVVTVKATCKAPVRIRVEADPEEDQERLIERFSRRKPRA